MRVSISGRPESWHTIFIGADESPVRIKYHILTDDEVADLRSEELQLLRKHTSSEEEAKQVAQLDMLLELLSPEARAKRKALVLERVLDWDLEDADSPEKGAKLPCIPEHIEAIYALSAFAKPLYKGIIDASDAGAKKI